MTTLILIIGILKALAPYGVAAIITYGRIKVAKIRNAANKKCGKNISYKYQINNNGCILISGIPS